MAPSISYSDFSLLSEFVSEHLGLNFPMEHWSDLKQRIRRAALELGFIDLKSFIEWLLSTPLSQNTLMVLANYLTIGETYFFREKKSYEFLENQILPEVVQSRQESGQSLRIWSAGCSTGEEPYSIAILLSKMIRDLPKWNITILATDISSNSLRKASEGIYSEWSFRDELPWLKTQYFKKRKAHFELLPDIKKMVTFDYHNLAKDTFPSLLTNTNSMDLIFCRNVLMYLTPERAKKVLNNLYLSLAKGGWLAVSPCEASFLYFPQFVTVNLPDVVFYRKDIKNPLFNGRCSVNPYRLHYSGYGSQFRIHGNAATKVNREP